jgi:hypothetical protein
MFLPCWEKGACRERGNDLVKSKNWVVKKGTWTEWKRLEYFARFWSCTDGWEHLVGNGEIMVRMAIPQWKSHIENAIQIRSGELLLLKVLIMSSPYTVLTLTEPGDCQVLESTQFFFYFAFPQSKLTNPLCC